MGRSVNSLLPINFKIRIMELSKDQLEQRITELETELAAITSYFENEREAHEFVKASLAENEERLRNVLSSVPTIICVLDDQFRVTYVAGQGVRDLDINVDDIMHRKIADVLEFEEGVEERLESVIKGESYERLIQVKGHWLEVTFSPYKTEDNPRNTMIAVATDVTQRIVAHENHVNRQKLEGILEVTGAISHELNQPLQTITTAAEFLMLKVESDPETEKNLNYILDSVDRMVNIIQQLTQLTRYETMKYTEKTKILDILKASEKRDDEHDQQ